MQLQPTFSIITITYNAVRLVEQTLLNVLSQSYPNIEYIVTGRWISSDGMNRDWPIG